MSTTRVCGQPDQPRPPCIAHAGPVEHVIRGYYIRAQRGSYDLYLCEAHAGQWNRMHPFGPRAEKLVAK
jgi:hypothetical protein